MKIDKDKNKEEFSSLLRSTGRDGVDYVLEDLEKGGFFEAPASAGHHLNVAGGLCQHSINTCRAALMVWEGMQKLDPSVKAVKRESVIIASLLHDVCKTDIYKPTVKKRRTPIGTWEDVQGYGVTYKHFPMGHGEKSVYIISGYLYGEGRLTRDEACAIRWHMGFSGIEDKNTIGKALEMYPLAFALHVADMEATYFLEGSNK